MSALSDALHRAGFRPSEKVLGRTERPDIVPLSAAEAEILQILGPRARLLGRDRRRHLQVARQTRS